MKVGASSAELDCIAHIIYGPSHGMEATVLCRIYVYIIYITRWWSNCHTRAVLQPGH